MEWRNDKVEGAMRVETDLEFAGLVAGPVTVASGATLHLTGMAASLWVEPGATAVVRGTVTDAALNAGGHLEIYGTVGSTRDVAASALTQIMPGAIVDGIRK